MGGTGRRGEVLILLALGVGGVAIAATAGVVLVTDLEAGVLTRDLRTLSAEAGAELPFLAGAVSQLNVMVWAAGGALALLVAALRPDRRQWLVTFGALLLVLAADDALTLHESASSRFELAFYAIYAVVGLVLAIGALRAGLDDRAVTFVIGGALLSIAALIDLSVTGQYLLEDSPKLLGAMVWVTVPLVTLEP